MEENVALDTSKQRKFIKSIKGIKKLIQKAGKGDVPDNVELKRKSAKKSIRKRPERGLVYLSHIPHGFYEHEMAQYFKQFGAVSNVRVIRSKRTGNSKGFAFVEFKQPAVAEIVAETMNNYLMGKRLIKAAYIPPEKQRPKAMRKHWSRLNNPGRTERLKQKKAYNEDKDEQGELTKAKKIMKNFNKNVKKLSELGINYDFFTPVDIPDGLSLNTDNVKDEINNKKNKDTTVEDKDSKSQKKIKSIKDAQKSVKETNNGQKIDKKEKKNKPEPVVNRKEQNQKQQKLKDAGVKPPENFIKLEETDDSDSSADFDSDDYNKMLENDSDADSDEESDNGESGENDKSDDSGDSEEESTNGEEFEITGSEDEDSDVDESEHEEVIPLPKKSKGKAGPVLPQVVQTKKQATQKGPAAQKQKGPIAPVHRGPIAPVTKGPIAPTQKGPIAPVKKGPIAPVKKGPIAPVPKGPIAPVPKGPIAPVQKGPKAQKKQESPEQIKRKAPQRNAVSPKKPKFEKQTQQPMKKQFKKKK